MTELSPGADALMPLQICAISDAAAGIRSFELRRADHGELPPFTPGDRKSVV